MALFDQMQPGEQAHSFRILHRLIEQGQTHHDLFVAALLHDVGKIQHPLRPWERALIVVCESFFPAQVKKWGQGTARGWRRPFVVAEQHPAWGAQLAAEAGASPLAVALIERHQEPPPKRLETTQDQLLFDLRVFDNES
jgi:hypothetical protein